MPGRCGGTSGCACAVTPGTGIDVAGTGTPENPYVVGLSTGLATDLEVADTASVNLALTGDGSPGDPFQLSGTVPDGVVTPATNPTMDLVGSHAAAPLTYDGATHELGLLISSDPNNSLTIGTDDGLHVGPPEPVLSDDAGNIAEQHADGLYVPTPNAVGTAWMMAQITDDTPVLQVTITATSEVRPASVATWLWYMTPRPTVGDYVVVLPGGDESGDADPDTVLIIGFNQPLTGWSRARVAATTPDLTVELDGWAGNMQFAVAMPTYTPVVDDVVVVLQPGGFGGGGDPKFLILGLAP